MHRVSVVIPLAFVVRAHANEVLANHILYKSADKLVNKVIDELFDRAAKVLSLQNAEMDSTSLGKPGHPAAAPRTTALLGERLTPGHSMLLIQGWRSAPKLRPKRSLPVRPAYDKEFALNGYTRYRTASEVGEDAVTAGGGTSPVQGKLVLITGANSGIGKETARVLGTVCGANVLLACRTSELAAETASELSRELDLKKKIDAGRGSFTPILHPLDLSSQDCVRDAAEFILKNHLADAALDRLICNAGLAGVPGKAVTTEGHEIHFGVNHLGHFTLVNKLLDSVKKSDDGRVLVVASETHRLSKLNLEDLMISEVPEQAAPFMRYGQSKLANLLFAKELSSRLAAFKTVSVYTLCPGLINSGLGRYGRETEEGREQQDKMYKNAAESGLLKSIEEGAASSVYLAAASKDKLKASGSYYTNCLPLMTSDLANDKEVAEKLWKFSEEITQPFKV